MECPDRAVGITATVLIYVLVSSGLYVVIMKDDSSVVSSEAEEKREVILKILATYASNRALLGI